MNPFDSNNDDVKFWDNDDYNENDFSKADPKFNGDEDLKFNDDEDPIFNEDEGEYFWPTDFGPMNPFDSNNDDVKFWDNDDYNENDFSKADPKFDDYGDDLGERHPKFDNFDDEPYTIDAYDSYDGSPKKVDDGKYNPDWDRRIPRKVDDRKYEQNWDRPNFRGQNRQPIEY